MPPFGGFGLVTGGGLTAGLNAQFFQNHFQRAELGESTLKKVEPYEGVEPQPFLALEQGASFDTQAQGEQDK
jgi:hypothetical protein